MIFAYGTSDPAPGQDIGYHAANRGTKALNLISIVKANTNEKAGDNIEIFENSIMNVGVSFLMIMAIRRDYSNHFSSPGHSAKRRDYLLCSSVSCT